MIISGVSARLSPGIVPDEADFAIINIVHEHSLKNKLAKSNKYTKFCAVEPICKRFYNKDSLI